MSSELLSCFSGFGSLFAGSFASNRSCGVALLFCIVVWFGLSLNVGSFWLSLVCLILFFELVVFMSLTVIRSLVVSKTALTYPFSTF